MHWFANWQSVLPALVYCQYQVLIYEQVFLCDDITAGLPNDPGFHYSGVKFPVGIDHGSGCLLPILTLTISEGNAKLTQQHLGHPAYTIQHPFGGKSSALGLK